MRHTILIVLAVLLVQGCSAGINQSRIEKNKEIASKLTVGTQKSDIIKTLGNPIKKEGDYIDFYTISPWVIAAL